MTAEYGTTVSRLAMLLREGDAQDVLQELLYAEDVDLFYDALTDVMSIAMLQEEELHPNLAKEVRRFVRRISALTLTGLEGKRKDLLLTKYEGLERAFRRSGVTSVSLPPVGFLDAV